MYVWFNPDVGGSRTLWAVRKKIVLLAHDVFGRVGEGWIGKVVVEVAGPGSAVMEAVLVVVEVLVLVCWVPDVYTVDTTSDSIVFVTVVDGGGTLTVRVVKAVEMAVVIR